MEIEAIINIAIALGLGLLVGMQREWSHSQTAGVRTFACIALFGALMASVPETAAMWCVAAGLLCITILLVLSNVGRLLAGDVDIGLTTEVAALVIYAVGAAAGFNLILPAVVVGGTTALLLHWKEPIHGLIGRIGASDFRAIAHLVLIALVILPILPDETFGPYDVLNPYKIWLMVVLIVGISLVAYAAQRMLGAQQGAVLGGLLGGLVSSTATTVSYARQASTNPQLVAVAALVIMLASTVVNLRALFEIGIVAPGLLAYAAPPMMVLTVAMLGLCIPVYLWSRRREVPPPQTDNPAQLKAAVIFGLLYAVVLFVVAAVQDQFGQRALYAVALISGLTDVDAITLSTARLYTQKSVDASTAWRVVLLAAMSNLVFKGMAAALLGTRRLGLYIAVLFGISLAVGGLLFFLWPEWIFELPEEATSNT